MFLQNHCFNPPSRDKEELEEDATPFGGHYHRNIYQETKSPKTYINNLQGIYQNCLQSHFYKFFGNMIGYCIFIFIIHFAEEKNGQSNKKNENTMTSLTVVKFE